MFADCKYAKIKNWCIENEYESIFLNNYPSKVAWLRNIQYMKKSFQMEKKKVNRRFVGSGESWWTSVIFPPVVFKSPDAVWSTAPSRQS